MNRFFTRAVVFVFLMSLEIFSANANPKVAVYEQLCGEYIFKVLETEDDWPRDKLISVHKDTKKETVFFTGISEGVQAACFTDRDGKEYMFFHDVCLGNAYSDMRYGLYDPKNNKLLFKPEKTRDSNIHKLGEVLGYFPMEYFKNFDKLDFVTKENMKSEPSK